MVVISQAKVETVEVPVALLENWDRRLALLQVLVLIMKLLIDNMRCEERERRRRLLWPSNQPFLPFVGG